MVMVAIMVSIPRLIGRKGSLDGADWVWLAVIVSSYPYFSFDYVVYIYMVVKQEYSLINKKTFYPTIPFFFGT